MFDTTMPSTQRRAPNRGMRDILDRLDALECDHGAVPILAQERKVFPIAERTRVGLLQLPCAEGGCLARLRVSRRETRAERVQVERELERGARAAAAVRLLLVYEDRVGRVDLRADAHGEG